MKRFLFAVCLILLLSLSAIAQQHIVLFKNGVPANFASTVARLGGEVVTQHPVLAVVKGLSAQSAISLSATAGVADVQADQSFTLDDTFGPAASASVSPASATDPTTAYLWPYAWNMKVIGGQYAYAAGKYGSRTTTVAVIDTGVDYLHGDLTGYVDLSRSTSFQDYDNALVNFYFPDRNVVTDLYFHGTHVANTIVSHGKVTPAVTSNVTLIAVKALGYDPVKKGWSGSLSAVLNSVLWAADHGADVANMSLGGGFAKAGNGRSIGYINSVFNYAHRKGMLIVVSAGNDTADLDHNGNMFASYCAAPNVVCVSATGPTSADSDAGPYYNIDSLASYSNYGRSSIDVAAPGGNGDTYVYAGCSSSSLVIPDCQDTRYIYYIGAQGTSMAAPHVSGLAALLVDQIGHGKPSQIKAALEKGADDLGQPGTDPAYGKGRINVPNTLGIPY